MADLSAVALETAEEMGFEPMLAYAKTAFETVPLQPLRYSSMNFLNRPRCLSFFGRTFSKNLITSDSFLINIRYLDLILKLKPKSNSRLYMFSNNFSAQFVYATPSNYKFYSCIDVYRHMYNRLYRKRL